MGLDLIPAGLRDKYRFDEREHATAILASDFKQEFHDILDCLDAFCLVLPARRIAPLVWPLYCG
ncbi:MAG: hypothetical protein WD278_03495 [Pirellulales bacterium]